MTDDVSQVSFIQFSFATNTILTVVPVFSAPKYCDSTENKGAYINIGPDLKLEYHKFDAVPHPDIKPMVSHLFSRFLSGANNQSIGLRSKLSHVVHDVGLPRSVGQLCCCMVYARKQHVGILDSPRDMGTALIIILAFISRVGIPAVVGRLEVVSRFPSCTQTCKI